LYLFHEPPEGAVRVDWDRVIQWDELADLFEAGEITIEEVRANCGHIPARNLLLAKYATDQRAGWPRVDYPPKMFISHKWGEDGSPIEEAEELAETLKRTGVDVVYDRWWDDAVANIEQRIAQIAESRTVFFLLTPDYLNHTSMVEHDDGFHATWVEEEWRFVHHQYTTQLKNDPDTGSVIDPTALLFDPDREPAPWFNRLFDVRTTERWQEFLATFEGLRVQTLKAAEQASISIEAKACVETYLSGRESQGFSELAMLTAKYPFVGDLAVMLVNMAREVGDLDRARDVARLGTESTESWRWEHRWLRAQWEKLG
jgi:hypothetical protein